MNKELTKNPANPKQRGNYNLTNFVSNYDDLNHTAIGDILTNFDSEKYDYLSKSQEVGILGRVAYYLNLANPLEWFFLVVFAIIVTFFIVIFDFLIVISQEGRIYVGTLNSPTVNIIFWIFSSSLLFLLATSVGYFISADADGSGIPEMKTVLSGITINRYFSFNTFIAKVIGLYAYIVSGASVGKAGPYVHLSSLICTRLLKFKIFSKINESVSSKNNMLSAAISAGITLACGATLGGVLFSIEVTSSFYVVSNIWKSFFCSVLCHIFSRVFWSKERLQLFHVGETDSIALNSEIILFMIVGLFGGIIGALLATFTAKGSYIRRKTTIYILNNRFSYALIISIIVAITTFIIVPLRNRDKDLLTFLFSIHNEKEPGIGVGLNEIRHPNEGITVFYLFFFKFVLSVLCLTVNAPSGIISTCFTIGGLFGRSYGHFVGKIFNTSNEAIYAMIGGACVLAGATHSISSALIIFELTGETSYLAPLLLATLISNLTAQSLSMNLYDVMGAIKNLPHLPSLKNPKLYHLTADDLKTDVHFSVEKDNFTYMEAINILQKLPRKYIYAIPILSNGNNIEYTISGKTLYKYITKKYAEVKDRYNEKMQEHFTEFFELTRKKFYSSHKSFWDHLKKKCVELFKKLKDKRELNIVDEKSFEEDTRKRLNTLFNEDVHDDEIFLKEKIDIEDPLLNAEKSAFTIDHKLSALKVQFLFTFLNVSHIFVTSKGELVGKITKAGFIKKSSLLED